MIVRVEGGAVRGKMKRKKGSRVRPVTMTPSILGHGVIFLTKTPSQCSAESVPHSQAHLEIDSSGEQKDLDWIYQAFPLFHVHHIWWLLPSRGSSRVWARLVCEHVQHTREGAPLHSGIWQAVASRQGSSEGRHLGALE